MPRPPSNSWIPLSLPKPCSIGNIRRASSLQVPEQELQQTPRGRSRRATDLDPAVDWVGPPSESSNLRPIRYAPMFTPSPPPPSRPDTPGSPSPKHPYSLQEFNAQPRTLPPRLQALRSELDAADLQWRLHRQRVDACNDEWWGEAATAFTRCEAAADAEAESDGAGGTDLAAAKDAARSRAYRTWLDDRRASYAAYNRLWWVAQGGLVKGGWFAQKRLWKWRWECFKAGIAP